jgi:hypothetical protein
MNQGSPIVNSASKDILARLLASEDLIVQHSASAQTASFDTRDRILTLPVWEDMDSFLYDMLVGHEVSHALYTPSAGWIEFIGEGPDRDVRQMSLNICEDARIERLIKDKFPGLRRDFAKAYKSLHDRGIFQIEDKNINEFPLIDRINLYYKGEIYGQMTVQFTAEERNYITRLDVAKTFEDVAAIAEDLAKKTAEDYPPAEQPEDDNESPEHGMGEGEGGSGSVAAPDSEEGGEGNSGNMSGDEENGCAAINAAGGDAADEDTDSGASMDDDTDDGSSADSTNSDDQQDGTSSGGLEYEDYSNEVGPGSTQHAYNNAVSDMRDNEAGEQVYYTVPQPKLENIIVPPDEIAQIWDGFDSREVRRYQNTDRDYGKESRERSLTELTEFQNRTKATVAQMVQHFQMKQAADSDKRTDIAKTGILDPLTMINYRWSEDIFLKNETHADGKSHGIVMYVDWSGSMCGILKDTLEQMLVLVEFCRKAGIPYDVYAFSSHRWAGIKNELNRFKKNNSNEYHDYHRESKEWDKYHEDHPQFSQDATDFAPHNFTLFHFLSSKLNARSHKVAVQSLYRLSTNGYNTGPGCFNLGGTPLNEAVISALDIVPQFQADNDVQIANVVFLTDGDAHASVPSGYCGSNNIHIRDDKTRQTYRRGHRDTDALLRLLKDRTSATLIGIRLHDSKNIKSLRYRYWQDLAWEIRDKKFQKAIEDYKKQNFCLIDDTSYDEEFVVMGALTVETDALEELPCDASATRIRNAFIKGGNRKKSSRVIATRLVDLIAVG